MSSRAMLRGLRLLHERGFITAPAKRLLVRPMANTTVPPATACSSCQKQVLELRKEMVLENQRVWTMYKGMIDINHSMLKQLCEIEAESAKWHAEAVKVMVKTSYRILSSGAFLMGAVAFSMSPVLKAIWQEDAIEAMEQRMKEGSVASLSVSTV